MKPSGFPSSFLSGIISPSPQNRDPSFRLCQRSSLARPCISAAPISCSGKPFSTSSTVKKTWAYSPHISASVQPRTRSAPVFQLVTWPDRSIEMMP